MKRMLAFLLAVTAVLVLSVSCTTPSAPPSVSIPQLGDFTITESETPTDYVLISMTDGSGILIELYPDIAPITVQNFKNLVSRYFYDGTIFHRVISGFMIQGGDSDGDGIGGSDKTIKGEFAANGVNNPLSHKRGVISMARTSNSYNSASSQFFIVHQDSTYLDGQYAAFGRVIAGIETVDKIAAVSTNASNRPLVAQTMESIRFVTLGSLADSTESDSAQTTEPPVSSFDESLVLESEEPTNYVWITMEDGSDMLIELYPDIAPITVQNFKDLVSQRFYDGVTFHRIISGFMIQGGDPDGDGIGGSDTTIKGEFAANGVNNPLSHTRGVISMARTSNSYNSASSQFFIVHRDSTYLDGQYAAFGRVIAGIETVDKIAAVSTGYGDRPLTEQKMAAVRFATLVTEDESTEADSFEADSSEAVTTDAVSSNS